MVRPPVSGLTAVFLSLWLAGSLPAASGEAAAPARIDKDIKLVVPAGQVEPVRAYISERYRDAGVLRRFGGPGASQESASEDFTDVYYDTPGLALLDKDVEVRHRRRYTGEDVRYKVKEWVQVKVPTPETGAPQEIKYKVKNRVAGEVAPYGSEPVYPFLAMLKSADRGAASAAFPALLGVAPADLVPVVVVRQHRDRVYIQDPEGPVFTVSVDRVTARKLWARVDFCEVEIEINELRYARRSSAAENIRLARLQREIADDLLGRFPALRLEQAPRYQKVYRGLETRLRPLPLRPLLRLGVR
ncbi:MAG: hypothetical protein A2X36_16755 [Elusimicrobia bacterium GWA2_69_24]|nr:MAG: hypothetical protein A2X36_16755 [Elusimicrobia bacterium GWA2_69_24]